MNSLEDNNIMVLDTEFETIPKKRLISLAYIIYKNNKRILKKSRYIKYHPEIFKVDESGYAFKYHKLTNDFLQKNGKSLDHVLNNFFKDLEDVDIIVGQNIIPADIQLIRKESIGVNIWFDKIRPKLQQIKIYDTMKAFKKTYPKKKYKLNDIYKDLFDEEMKDHHKAIYDCKNTYKCFYKMFNDNNFNFINNDINFAEDYYEESKKAKIKCSLCENKIYGNTFKYKSDQYKITINDKHFEIINSKYLNKNDIICKKCFQKVELLITNNENVMLDVITISNKNYNDCAKKFFDFKSDDSLKRKDLVVNYKDKDKIKKLGAKWDFNKKCWFFQYKEDSDLNRFSNYISI